MNLKKLIEASHRLSKPYRVAGGRKFRLAHVDPADTGELKSEDKPRAKEALHNGVAALAELQDILYAQDRWSLLLIFQAMDAAGKDGTIKHVMSGVNPQGCQVFSFKAPTSEDLDHDFLWRCQKQLPERGRIGIFNRSYYEETLVGASSSRVSGVRRSYRRSLSRNISGKIAFEDIRAFERYLHRNGTAVIKFFLNVSKDGAAESDFWSGWMIRIRIGSSPRTTQKSAASGTTTWKRTRKRSAKPQRRIRHGMWCPRITSGSRA